MEPQRSRSERGQAAIMMTMTLIVTLGLMSLVVDIGLASWRKEACFSAAQAAAFASAMAAKKAANLTCGSGVVCQAATNCAASPTTPPANNIDNGCLYAKQDGFTTTGNYAVSMASGVSGSPVTGVAPAYWVTATVSQNMPTLFSAVLRQQWLSVKASATAGVFLSSGGGCIYVLNGSGTGITNSGNVSITSGCGVYVDSSSSSAVLFSGSASITTTGSAKTNIVGGFTKSGSAFISPSPILGAAVTPDPFLGKLPAAPAAGSCQANVNLSGSGTTTIPAGTYCSAITISGSVHLVLTSGTYVLQGGISMSGPTSISATGPVTLYAASGGISMSGTGGIDLTAPSSGAYSGMLIWQPYSNTSSDTLSGGTSQQLNGVVYVPAAGLSYSGGSSTIVPNTTLVCNTLTMSGSSYINNPASNSLNSTPGGVYLLQ